MSVGKEKICSRITHNIFNCFQLAVSVKKPMKAFYYKKSQAFAKMMSQSCYLR